MEKESTYIAVGAQGVQGIKGVEEPNQTRRAVTVIGDSLVLNAEPYLKELIPARLVVDGKVGRQMANAAERIQQLEEQGQLGAIVVIALGTNGKFTDKQLEAVWKSIGRERSLVLVNTRVPRPWQAEVNESLAKAATSWPNVSLADWHAESEGNDAYFATDGVHLTRSGAQSYAAILDEAVKAIDAIVAKNTIEAAAKPKLDK